ncbi:hypothetical protein [Pseudodesulfovibrio mercurii]|nr:hypothetical protein [Pseudodesulfovibrio mercurii]
MAEAHLAGMAVIDRGEVMITETPSTVEVGYMGRFIELPMSRTVADDAARYLIGAAVCADSQCSGRYLYAGPIID